MRGLERTLGTLVRKAAAKIAAGEAPPLVVARRRAEGLDRPAEGRRRGPRAHPDTRCRHRSRRHRPRRRRAVRRDDRLPDRRRRRAWPHAHRPARRRDEGVGADRAQLRALARRRARRRPGDGSTSASTSTCRRARCPRTVRRPGITMTTALVSLLTERPVTRHGRDDRRDHAPGSGAADRRPEAEGARRPPGRAHARSCCRSATSPTSRTSPSAVRNEMTFHLAERYSDVAAAAFAP